MWQYRCREAFRRNSGDRNAAGRSHAGSGDSQWRLQRRARVRSELGGRVSHAASGCKCGNVYGGITDRGRNHEDRCGVGQSRFRSNLAEKTRRSSSAIAISKKRSMESATLLFSIRGRYAFAQSEFTSSARSLSGFVDALKQKAESLRIGSPLEKTTDLGPLISKQHREKVLGYYRLAREEGATIVTGGGVPEFGSALDHGFYVQPTIYTGLAESARSVKEEIFGPVCHVAPFDTEEQAVSMANDTKYGLAASIWTTNLKRGHRVAQQMNVGITWVNCWFLRDLRTPFGGCGAVGDRPRRRHALAEFLFRNQ